MSSLADVVEVGGNGGDPFNFNGTKNGSLVKKIHVWEGRCEIQAMKVWLTDGRSEQFGFPAGNAKEFTFEDDEHFTSLSLWANKDGSRLGAIKFKTNHFREFCASLEGSGLKPEVPVDVASGICVGIKGHSGLDIDRFGFIFINTDESAEMINVEYPTIHEVKSKNMSSLADVVEVGGNGGDPFNFNGTENGSLVKKIHVWEGRCEIQSMKVWLTDGRSEQFGKPAGIAKEFTFEDDEHFTSLSLSANENGTRLGAIKFKTSHSREFCASLEGSGLKPEVPVDVASGICVGIKGHSGLDIDRFGFIFINTDESAEMINVEYPTIHEVKSKNMSSLADVVEVGGNGGDPFNFNGTENGSMVKKIHVWEGRCEIQSMKVWLTDGRSEQFGKPAGIAKEFTFEDDEHFTSLSLSANENGTRLGAIKFKTSHSREFCASLEGSGLKPEVPVDVASGICVGIKGHSGLDIDRFGFIFINTDESAEMINGENSTIHEVKSKNMSSLADVVEVGGIGGDPFNFNGTENGSLVKKIHVWEGRCEIKAMKVWLTDGSSEQFGKPAGNAKEFTFEDDEHFTSLSLSANKDGTRLGAIKFKTSHSRKFYASLKGSGLKAKVSVYVANLIGLTTCPPLVPVDVASGLCMGIKGRSSSDIDRFGFIFINNVESAEITNVKYPTIHEVIPKVDFGHIKSMSYKNNTSDPQEYTIETSKKITQKSSWSVTGKLNLTYSVRVNAGIPLLVQGSSRYELNIGVEATYASETSEEKMEHFSFPVKVSPGKEVTVSIKLGEATLNLPFTGTMKITCCNGGVLEYKTSGTYKGVAFSDGYVIVNEFK